MKTTPEDTKKLRRLRRAVDQALELLGRAEKAYSLSERNGFRAQAKETLAIALEATTPTP